MKYIKPINEIGDASAKKFRYKGPSSKQILAYLDEAYNNRTKQSWSDQKAMNWEFRTENAEYVVNIDYSVNTFLRLGGRRRPGTTPRRRQLNASLGFSVKADKKEDRERSTNFGEHFRVLATVCDIFVDFINAVQDDYILKEVYMIPKAENDEAEDADNQRGRFYEAYIKKQIKRIKRKVTVQTTTIKTDDGNVVGGFVLTDGHIHTMGGNRKEFRNEQFNEAESRDPRKKGEHKGSSSHSDLYTDEDPKGTIHGLGFKDAKKAEDSIEIIKKVDREHAHKVQATLVMQQRAKVAIERTKDPEKKKNLKAAYEIWTKFLEEMKKKTQELKESWTGQEVADHIKYITPDDSDIPDFFIDKYILPNDGWQNKPIKLKNLLKDKDFKTYYKSGEERYDEYEVSGDDLYQELVVYKGQLLDGYSRAARMLRNGEKTAAAFVIENRYVMNMELFERYTKLDSVSNQLLKDCFRQWVLDFERGKKSSSYSFSVENPGLTFDLDCSIYFKGKGFEVLDSTGADARDEDDDGDWQDPFIHIDFACNPEWLPTYWSEVYFNLADVLRHEIEHITQDGVDAGNYRKGKPNQPDDYMRGMIKQGIIPKYYYLLLPKEVDANLQGLRFEAKKRREKLIDACNRYLDIKVEMGYITPEEKEEVLIKWEARAKHLGFKLR